jgi:ubiquinone biosynthesis protein COQ4
MAIKYRQALRATLTLLRDPNDFPALAKLADALARWSLRLWPYRRMIDKLPPEEVEHLRELTARPLDLDALLRLPENTFGHGYAAFLRRNRIDPDGAIKAYPPIAHAFAADWLLMRFLRTHDMHHFLLGWSFDFANELGLQFFIVRNFQELYGALAIGSLPVSLVTHRGEARQILHEVVRGWDLGGKVPNLFWVPFEDMYERDLESVRAELGLA